MWTPPLTPAHGQGNTHSASSSVSGIPVIPAARRESEQSESGREDATSGPKKRELQTVPEEEGRESKKRRIVPTPVTMSNEGDSAIASEESTPALAASGQQ
jgi:chromatin assembly factor 1 subunit B